MLCHDTRLRGSAVEIEARGGVLHLTGELRTRAEFEVVRGLFGQLHGVLAVWDRIRIGGHTPDILDIGCGDTKQYPDALGLDCRPGPAVDVVAELGDGIPLRDESADRIFAVHVLEHMIDFLPVVDECHRVLRPGGILHILSPWWRHVNAVADPTHVRLLDVQTIKGICRRPGLRRRWYPLHAACDGATVFADLRKLGPGEPDADERHMARFFD